MDCNDKETKATMIQGQLVDAFGAKKVQLAEKDVPYWESIWLFQKSAGEFEVQVSHYILFNDDKCKSENAKVFTMLANNAKTSQQNRAVHTGTILEKIGTTAFSTISNYVRSVDKAVEPAAGAQKEHAGGREKKTNQSESPSVTVSKTLFKNSVDAWIKMDLGVSNKELQLLKWGLREMPPALSEGEFEPDSFSIALQHQHVIRIDLPGLSIANKLKSTVTPPKSSNWYKIRQEDKENSNPDNANYCLIVEGLRAAAIAEDTGKGCGAFKLTFQVPHRYKLATEVLHEHGTLIIKSTSRLHEDEHREL